MTGRITGGGRKEEAILNLGDVIEGTVDGKRVEIHGTTDGFWLRKIPHEPNVGDTLYLPPDTLALDDGTRIDASAPPEYELTPYDQTK